MIILFSAFLAQASPEQASIYLRQGNCYEAIQAYPDPEENHYKVFAIGKCHLQMGQLDQADMMLDEVSPPQNMPPNIAPKQHYWLEIPTKLKS